MEQDLKNQLIKSADAIRKKVKQLKDHDFNTNTNLKYFFKQIADPLNIIAANKQISVIKTDNDNDNNDDDDQFNSANVKSKICAYNSNNKNYNQIHNTNTRQQVRKKNECESSEESGSVENFYSGDEAENTSDSEKNYDTSLQKEDIIDIYDKIKVPFGVYSHNNKHMIGNTEVNFTTTQEGSNKIYNIHVANKKYKITPGLKELLLRKNPKISLVNLNDKLAYKEILIATNAHKRDFDPTGQIKGDKGFKYSNIIKPLFSDSTDIKKSKRGAGLPSLKKYKKNTELVYWDDPNELVERLKLLIASKTAGNTNLDNEILSIIEELKEAGIIKK